MKFLCPACERLVELSTFHLEGAALVLQCPACGRQSSAASSASVPAASSPSPFAAVAAPLPGDANASMTPPEDCCPKCISPRAKDAVLCSQCGLVFANFTAADHQPSEALRGHWQTLLESWNDPKAHDRFLSQAMELGELPSAGRLYRIRLARSPGDSQASRGRDEVLRLVTTATFQLESLASSADVPTRSPWQYLGASVLGAGVLWGFWTLFRAMISLRMP